ncbi:hypothetical protein MAR_027692 [Mya arenaria]|uniref:Uncharacterized protein n=1 Tax=Mya arenaria TaxID=6604 RepID=A0ABY7EXA8_MYAAR|nr:hypothetical protein MAR_027692 [Mya arenaria]
MTLKSNVMSWTVFVRNGSDQRRARVETHFLYETRES